MPRRPDHRSPPPPLDRAAAEALALHYVARYATTRARLAAYLTRKLRERGAEGAVDPRAIAEALAGRGYIDERGFAEGRARALSRRGMGGARIAGALRAAAIPDDVIAAAAEEAARETPPLAAALALARRRRIGPFATQPADAKLRERHVAVLIRAGHPHRLARRIAAAAPGEAIADED